MDTIEVVAEFGPRWAVGPFERGTDGPRVIVVGVDGSQTSLRAGSYAAGLARRQHSRLVVVYVATLSAWSGMAPGVGAMENDVSAETIEELRALMAARADDLGVPITLAKCQGEPYTALRGAATEVNADMVVVGASGHAGHRLIGSVANRLVRAARWPVVVVP